MYSRCDLSLVCVLFDPAIPTSFFNFIQLFLYLFLLRCIKDWDPRDNDIHSRVPAHRTAISQIDEFYTEIPVHT